MFDRFVNCLVKQFAICLGVFVILLLNVMELLGVVGDALLDRPCMVFALLMLFFCVILRTISSGKSLQLLCILLFGMLCFSAISMMFVNIMLAVCMLVGMVVCAKSDCVFRELCPVSFLVVGECPSVLL